MEFDEEFFTKEINGEIDHPHFLQRAKWIKNYIPPGSWVCILGCGFGHLVKHLRDLGVNVFGVDVSVYAFNCRVDEQVFCSPAESFKFPKGVYIFSWNLLDCLTEDIALKLSQNLKGFKQIHVVCCSGDYKKYYIKPKKYWNILFPDAIIIDYENPFSDLHIPLSWGRVSN